MPRARISAKVRSHVHRFIGMTITARRGAVKAVRHRPVWYARSGTCSPGQESIMPDGDAVEPKAEKGRRAFEVVYDKVRRELAEGVLKVGDKLPAERELAESLGFSRAAVREALRALEATGLVQLQKGVKGGAFIQNAN